MPGDLIYPPEVHPIADLVTGKITRPWLLRENAVSDAIVASGNVFGPPSVGTVGNIATFANTTGAQLADGGSTIDEVITEARLTFAHVFMLARR